MNIIQVSGGELRIPVEKGGGIEQYVFNISRYLHLAGHNVTLIDRKYSPDDPDVEYIDGVKIVRLKAHRFSLSLLRKILTLTKLDLPIDFLNLAFNQISFTRQVIKYLAQTNVDVIHSHSSVNTIFLSIMKPSYKSKLFFTCHATRQERQLPTLWDKMAFAVEGNAVKRSKKSIALSYHMRDVLINVAKVTPEKVLFMPVGVDVSTFNPFLEVSDIRMKYGLEGKFVIFFVGVICERKGVDYLVKAANTVVNEFGYKQVQFLLTGPTDGFGTRTTEHSPYLDKIKGYIKEFGLEYHVKLTGALPFEELRKLFVVCDVFILPSLAEAMPTAPLEAMASGKPVIGTKVGGMIIQIRDGQSGFLIDPADERQISEKIKYFIENPEKITQMGTYGRKLAQDEFSWKSIVERLLDIYKA